MSVAAQPTQALLIQLNENEMHAIKLIEEDCLQLWNIAPSLSLAGEQWLKRNDEFMNHKDYYDVTFESTQCAMKVGDSYFHGRRIRCRITLIPIDDTMRGVGIDWSGEASIVALESRTYDLPRQPDVAQIRQWSQWRPGIKTLMRQFIVRKNGVWMKGEPGLGFGALEGVPAKLEELPKD